MEAWKNLKKYAAERISNQKAAEKLSLQKDYIDLDNQKQELTKAHTAMQNCINNKWVQHSTAIETTKACKAALLDVETNLKTVQANIVESSLEPQPAEIITLLQAEVAEGINECP